MGGYGSSHNQRCDFFDNLGGVPPRKTGALFSRDQDFDLNTSESAIESQCGWPPTNFSYLMLAADARWQFPSKLPVDVYQKWNQKFWNNYQASFGGDNIQVISIRPSLYILDGKKYTRYSRIKGTIRGKVTALNLNGSAADFTSLCLSLLDSPSGVQNLQCKYYTLYGKFTFHYNLSKWRGELGKSARLKITAEKEEGFTYSTTVRLRFYERPKVRIRAAKFPSGGWRAIIKTSPSHHPAAISFDTGSIVFNQVYFLAADESKVSYIGKGEKYRYPVYSYVVP
ncbi:MAG: hypothetical protein ABEI52_11730, partial [Halobacteriaceae archaeon]